MNQRIAQMIRTRIRSRMVQEPEQQAATDAVERRNFRLALINGILIRIAFRFVDSGMILAAFVKQLTGSNIMVGLVSSTMRAGSVWPQLLMSNLLEHRPRKMPFYIMGSSLRITAWMLIALLTVLVGDKNHILLFSCFYFLYFLTYSALGVSMLPFNDIVAKSIPTQRRARLFSLRSLWGGIFGIAAGFAIKAILSDGFPLSFPNNYAFMFGICALMMIGSTVSFAFTIEPIHPVRDERRPLWEHLKRGPHFLKVDRDYRNYIILRMLTSLGIMCGPFYIPYALDRIGIPASAVGIYTAVGATSAVLSNFLWAYVGEKHSSKHLIIMCTGLAVAAPLMPIAIRHLPVSQQTWMYSIIFVLTYAFTTGRGIGYMTYSLNVAPSKSRPTYLGFLNTAMLPVSFVPVLTGALLKLMPYEVVFGLSSFISLIAMCFGFRLSNVDEKDDIESKDD